MMGFRAVDRALQMYTLFMFEMLLHNLPLGNSKMLNKCMVVIPSPETLMAEARNGD